MYDKLLQLPLFQGLCTSDLTKILEKVRLHFQRFQPGERIYSQGFECDKLSFLLDGTMTAETTDEKSRYTFLEDLDCPHIIEPYSVYGMNTKFDSSYLAKTEVGMVSIDKSYILNMLSEYGIFQLNFINMICNRSQNLRDRIWYTHIGEADMKILNFIAVRSFRPRGRKVMRIRMEDLATLVNETRINVSRALNEFQRLGLAELYRKEVIIPNLEDLIKYMTKKYDE